MKASVVTVNPEILGGTPVFRGTRVPIQTLFDYVKHDSIQEFMIGFPHISREMIDAVLDVAARKTITSFKPPKKNALAA